MLLVKVIIFVMTAIRNNKYDVYLCHSYNHANGVDIVRDTTIALLNCTYTNITTVYVL